MGTQRPSFQEFHCVEADKQLFLSPLCKHQKLFDIVCDLLMFLKCVPHHTKSPKLPRTSLNIATVSQCYPQDRSCSMDNAAVTIGSSKYSVRGGIFALFIQEILGDGNALQICAKLLKP